MIGFLKRSGPCDCQACTTPKARVGSRYPDQHSPSPILTGRKHTSVWPLKKCAPPRCNPKIYKWHISLLCWSVGSMALDTEGHVKEGLAYKGRSVIRTALQRTNCHPSVQLSHEWGGLSMLGTTSSRSSLSRAHTAALATPFLSIKVSYSWPLPIKWPNLALIIPNYIASTCSWECLRLS